MTATAATVVFIEAEGSDTAVFRQLLQYEGLHVVTCREHDVTRMHEWSPHLLVIDQQRLGAATLSIVRRAEGRLARRPLTLALVGPGDEAQGVELVERGIDGYLPMSCGRREFVARARALLRRVQVHGGMAPPESDLAGVAGARVHIRHLDIDPARRRVCAAGRDLRLTEQEFQLLYVLAGNPGRIFDRPALLDAVWGGDTFVTERSVDALVKRLRHQLRPVLKDACFVETVRGVGYRLTESSRSS